MKDDLIHIKFDNQQNPNSGFDMIKIEDLFKKKELLNSFDQVQVLGFFMIIIIQESKGSHSIDFKEYPYHSGSILTVRKNQIHKFHLNKNVKGDLLLFTNDFLVSYLEKFEGLKTLQLFNEMLGHPKIQLNTNELTEVNSIIQRINTEYFEVKDSYSQSIIRSELHILITKLFRLKYKNQQNFFNKKYLTEFIEFQKLVEENITKFSKVNDYANLMSVSTKTLNNICQSVINLTAKAFIDDVYITHIKRLLLNSNDSIKEIAYSSGFEETPNFYKYFKRHTKTTPELFRKQNS